MASSAGDRHWYAVSLSDDGEDSEKLGVDILKKLRLTIDDEAQVYLLTESKAKARKNAMNLGKKLEIKELTQRDEEV